MLSIEVASMKIDLQSVHGNTRYHNHWVYSRPRYLAIARAVTTVTRRGSGGRAETSPDVRLQGGESSSITVSTMWIYLAIETGIREGGMRMMIKEKLFLPPSNSPWWLSNSPVSALYVGPDHPGLDPPAGLSVGVPAMMMMIMMMMIVMMMIVMMMIMTCRPPPSSPTTRCRRWRRWCPRWWTSAPPSRCPQPDSSPCCSSPPTPLWCRPGSR